MSVGGIAEMDAVVPNANTVHRPVRELITSDEAEVIH